MKNPLLGPVLLTPLENKENESVDDMDVGNVREIEITKKCDIKIYTSNKVPRKEEIQEGNLGMEVEKDTALNANEIYVGRRA